VVLKDVNLEIGQEQFWLILGPNGEGKTTLLRAFLGLLRPQRGQVWRHPSQARHECIGFVPQREEFTATLPTTVREFVSLGWVGIHQRRAERMHRLDAALEQAGLSQVAAQDFGSLSGGQRRRALVARALVRRPHVLMLDEPTAGLDVAVEDSFLRFLADLHHERKLSLLFVTHDLRIAARYATHVALVYDEGVEGGPRSEILTPERLQRAYRVPVRVEPRADGTVGVGVESVEEPS
jgi:ABC-type Mn2+/Zn2+ transport system ATPase subunit